MDVKALDFQDYAIRAAKTAAQAGLAILVASGTDYINIATWKAAAVAAGAALISFAHNAILGLKNQ